MKTVYKVGVIGSGSISDIYISNMKNVFKNLDVVACSATTLEHAKVNYSHLTSFEVRASNRNLTIPVKKIDI